LELAGLDALHMLCNQLVSHWMKYITLMHSQYQSWPVMLPSLKQLAEAFYLHRSDASGAAATRMHAHGFVGAQPKHSGARIAL